MDRDPELDVTLSDGRQVAIFQIAALAGREAWAIVEPRAPLRVIRGSTEALAARERLDGRIAARLAAGWVPVDRRGADKPSMAPVPLPPDLVLQITSLLEGLACGRAALHAADPSGQLWAACQVFRQQAWRVGVSAPNARVLRARQERRLGELAEQAGDRAAALFYYRAALASFARVGVARRLRQLEAYEPRRATGIPRVRPGSASPPAGHDSTRLLAVPERSWVSGHAARPHTRSTSMNSRVQIVGRLPVALNRHVRAAATHQKVSLNTFLINALAHAVGRPRRAIKPEAAT